MSLDVGSFEAWHICYGKSLLRCGSEDPDLKDNRPLWRTLWGCHREALIADWVTRNPGSRPIAFWELDSADLPGRLEGESEVEHLHRIGQLGPGEVEAIVRRARDLARYDSTRTKDRGFHNWIAPGPLERFAADRGLLTDRECEILDL